MMSIIKKLITKLFKRFKFYKVFHLAAQAGVRNSIKNLMIIFQQTYLAFATY